MQIPSIFFDSPLESVIKEIPLTIGYNQDEPQRAIVNSKIDELKRTKTISIEMAQAYHLAASNLIYERTEQWCGRTSYCNIEQFNNNQLD